MVFGPHGPSTVPQELLSEAAPGSTSLLEALASLLTIAGPEFDKEDFKWSPQGIVHV